jgi:hypothetical protein
MEGLRDAPGVVGPLRATLRKPGLIVISGFVISSSHFVCFLEEKFSIMLQTSPFHCRGHYIRHFLAASRQCGCFQ